MTTSRLRHERFMKGLCVRCGKNPPIPGVKYCEECQKKYADYSREYQKRKRIRAQGGEIRMVPKRWPTGWCFVCGEETEGSKLCEKHKGWTHGETFKGKAEDDKGTPDARVRAVLNDIRTGMLQAGG